MYFSNTWKRASSVFQSSEILLSLVFCMVLAAPWAAHAQMLESFEYGVPPAGWTKTNLLGGSGWYQLPIGVMPLPGWGNGTSGVPPTAGAGTRNAYCSWNTGGGASDGYHNDQWLISPRLTGLTATSSLSYWLRFAFTNFKDTVYVRISTNGPAPANFTYVIYTNIFPKGGWTNQFPPWTNTIVNIGSLGIPAGTPIWIAIQEYEWDNTWNGAAVQLDVITSDLTAPPEPRVNPTSLTFTAYYEGADPAPQTFSIQSIGSSGMGFSRTTAFGAGPTNWLTMGGPSSGTLAFQDSQTFTASVSVAGLDLGSHCATNIFTIPGAANSPVRVPITLNVIRRPQTIAFPNPGAQLTTNKVILVGTASSGLQVSFSVFSGPGSITGASNLFFTGTGTVRVVGWQLGNIYYNIAPCITNSITVTKPLATILFTNLSHVYDGSPHGATITTIPAGLTVDTTYNGNPALPVAIGTYAITSTVNDTLYGGTATSVFTITRMVQTIDFPDPGPQWTTNRVGLAATANSGLPVSFSVASGPGSISGDINLTFTGAGSVTVVASHPGDADWLPASATNLIAVTKVTASVTLNNLNQTYDGTPRVVTATTVPVGLTVDMTYNGSGTAPTAAGSYAVTGTVNDAIYAGANTGTLTVSKENQSITFPALQPRLTNAVVAFGATASSGLPVTEFAVVSGPGLVSGTNLTFSGTGDVLVEARQSGDGNWNAATAVTNLIKAFSVNPRNGLAAGGNAVMITNGRIGDGSSITNVTLCGVPAAILEQGTNWVNVQCGPGTPGIGDLLIQSDSDIVVSNAYAYNSTGTIFAAAPDNGSFLGGYQVVISGTNLCDGTDATNVTLCGVSAAVVGQSPTQIVVVAGAAAATGLGDVRVFSAGHGESVKLNGFEYVKADQVISEFLPTNGSVFAVSGTARLSATASSGLPVSFAVGSGPATITGGTNLTFNGIGAVSVVASQAGDALWNAATDVTNTFEITKDLATVTLLDLSHAYDGTPKSAAATTDPAGLVVNFTYDGSATEPFEVGTYTVTGTISDVTYQGEAAGTLVIGKASAGVYLLGLNQVFDGTPKVVTATTMPAGLVGGLTYDGSPAAPSAVGSYAVIGAVRDVHYQGSANGTLTIASPITKLYRVSSATQIHIGAPRAALPATARMTVDNNSTAWIVYFWTESGAKKVAGPFPVTIAQFDPLGHLWWLRNIVNRDVQLPPGGPFTTDQTHTADWQWIGSSTEAAPLPTSMRGIVQNMVFDELADDWAGLGFGGCSATAYRTLPTGNTTAWDAALAALAELQAQGYLYEPAIY